MAIEIKNWKPMHKGSLIGFADIYVPSWSLEIYGVSLFRKGHQQWVNFPSKEYTDKDSGEKKYAQHMRFPNRKHADAFAAQIFEGIAKWQPSANEPDFIPDENVPF